LWNYSVVHVRGNLKLLKTKKDLEWILSELAKRNERDLINLTSKAGLKNKEHKEWNYNELDEKYKNLQHNAITGFEIEIKEIIGKIKASQNKNITDKQTLMDGLENAYSKSKENFVKLMKENMEVPVTAKL